MTLASDPFSAIGTDGILTPAARRSPRTLYRPVNLGGINGLSWAGQYGAFQYPPAHRRMRGRGRFANSSKD